MIKYFLKSTTLKFQRATEGSSGYDLCADESRVLEPGHRALIKTGLYLSMPKGIEAQVRSRSGLSIKNGVVVLNAPGTVDSDYRGEVCVVLINLGQEAFRVVSGDRIAQIVFAPVFPWCVDRIVGGMSDPKFWEPQLVAFEELDETKRGEGGFGSTGK